MTSAERACDNCRKLTPMSKLRSLCPDCERRTPKELREVEKDAVDAERSADG